MAITETSHPLSIDSFSYSWLINLRPSLEIASESFRAALDSSDESFFIEMDPNMPPSRRFKKLDKDFDLDFDFGFDIPYEQSIAHADELFSNGFLLPLVRSSKADDTCTRSSSDDHKKRAGFLVEGKLRCSSLRRCRSLISRKMFEKYLYFLFPFLEKIRCCRSSKSSRKDRGTDNKIWAVKSNKNESPQGSPRTSVGSSVGGCRRSSDSGSSIHEAVLHCKRSIGM